MLIRIGRRYNSSTRGPSQTALGSEHHLPPLPPLGRRAATRRELRQSESSYACCRSPPGRTHRLSATIERRNEVALGADIGEGARPTSPRREIRGIGPDRSASRALRCPHDCTNPRTRANFASLSEEYRRSRTGWRREVDLNRRDPTFCACLRAFTRISFRRRETLAGKPGPRSLPVPRFSIVSIVQLTEFFNHRTNPRSGAGKVGRSGWCGGLHDVRDTTG